MAIFLTRWRKSHTSGRGGETRPVARTQRRVQPKLEGLEDRQVPSTLSPVQIRQHYGFDRVGFLSSAGSFQVGDGRNTTIAIVDAYNDPTIRGDLATFDAQYNIASPTSFRIVNQKGGNKLPGTDPGKGSPGDTGYRPPLHWEGETALDVEYAHAMAPAAKILLVEADSELTLSTAISYAASRPGVDVVSMSFGAPEYASETGNDAMYSKKGVTFVASTGDKGSSSPEYMAFSPNVVAVGGTTLDYSTAAGFTERGWTGGGGGISQYEAQPSYQSGVVTQSTTNRTIPDAAFTADSAWVYDTTDGNGWYSQGGTSLAAPIMAGLVSVIDQGRVGISGPNPYDSSDYLNTMYALPANAFTDITTGSNGGYSAATGYDLVTGLGTPNVPNFVAGMTGDAVQAPVGMAKWAGWRSGGTRAAVALTADNRLEVTTGGPWTVIETGVKDFGIAKVNGAPCLVTLLTNGQLHLRTDLSGDWSSINPSNDSQSMAVDRSGKLYELSFNTHGVYRYGGAQKWTNIDPVNDVQSMAVDGTGSLYVNSFKNHGVWKYTGSGWTNVDPVNDVQSMTVDGNGSLYVNSFINHGVWKYNGGQSWTNVDPVNDVQSMAVDATGSLYVLSFNNHGVWRHLDGTNWESVDPVNDVQSMSVDGSGSLYVNSFTNHGVWQYNGRQSWTNVDPVNDVKGMAVDGTGALYVSSLINHGVWKHNGGQSWTNVDPVNDVESMAVDATGSLYVLSSANHGVWRYNDGTSWTNVDPVNDAQSIAVDKTGSLYVLSSANCGVWRYNGGTSWTNVRTANDAAVMVVDNTGMLYVLTTTTHKVSRYDPFQGWVDTVANVRSMSLDPTGGLLITLL